MSNEDTSSDLFHELLTNLINDEESNVDNHTKLELTILKQQQKLHLHHHAFPPLFVKPVAKQFWLPDQLGGGSSLNHTPTTRVASTNDLVLDLVVVYILNQIVSNVANSPIVISLNGTVTPGAEGGDPELQPETDGSNESLASAVRLILTFVCAVSVFTPIWSNWYRTSVLLNRFEATDMLNYAIFGVNLVLMLFAGRGIHSASSMTNNGTVPSSEFLYGLVILETWQVAWLIYLQYHNPKYAIALAGLMFNLILTLMLYVCAAIFAETQCVVLSALFYWVAVSCDFGTYFVRTGSVRMSYCCQKKLSLHRKNVPTFR